MDLGLLWLRNILIWGVMYVCWEGRGQSLSSQLNYYRTAIRFYEVDVTSKEAVAHVLESIKEEVGPVDLLINNAGLGVFDLAENIVEESVHDMIDINLKGTIFCTQEVLPSMKIRNEGVIVNVVSTAGVEGKVNETVYCASKFGVRGFTESLSLELNETGIRVFGAYMGGMKSTFWDGILSEERIKDFMNPDDVADIIIENTKPRKNITVTEVIIKNKS
ncbi:short-subunit dehydrogenase [Neobacillus niacini]|nr:short-subunit dehydrogenase [Neobacillus niacini]